MIIRHPRGRTLAERLGLKPPLDPLPLEKLPTELRQTGEIQKSLEKPQKSAFPQETTPFAHLRGDLSQI